MRFPRIQGADIVGRVVGVGGGVNASRVGERVIVDNALYGGGEEGLLDSGLIGSERDGGFAEYVAVPAENAHAIESDLGDAELATFPTAYVTSLRMLNRARVSAGETVLVTGASGGVGSGLVQLARLRGARVEATLFDSSGQGFWRDSFFGYERRNTRFHLFIEPYPAGMIDARLPSRLSHLRGTRQ
jgi:NADPH:quinone reductase-like Zn-dependent oxidoreductase